MLRSRDMMRMHAQWHIEQKHLHLESKPASYLFPARSGDCKYLLQQHFSGLYQREILFSLQPEHTMLSRNKSLTQRKIPVATCSLKLCLVCRLFPPLQRNEIETN